MKIDGPLAPFTKPVRSQKGVKGSFNLGDSSDVTEVETCQETSKTPLISAPSLLMGLQEIIGVDLSQKDKTKHGQKLIDGLRHIQLELLGGAVAKDTLQALEKELQSIEGFSDPCPLTEILKEIRQRVAIELEKQKISSTHRK